MGFDSSKLLDRLKGKMNERVGHRGDLYLADWQQISKTAANVLIGYVRELGKPSSDDLHKFIIKNFDAKLVPQMRSARVYDNQGAITMVMEIYRPTRKESDTGAMIRLADTMFQDDMGTVWEAKSHDDGTRYLARIQSDNIDELLAERKNRMQIKSAGVTFSRLRTAGRTSLNVGDRIKLYYEGRIKEGVVKALQGEMVTCECPDLGQLDINKDAVIEVTQKSPAAEAKEDEYLKQYYTKAYGFPDYAEQLVKGETKTEDE
jgi:hypothetical protein